MQTEQARIVGYIRLAAPGQIEGLGDRAIPQMDIPDDTGLLRSEEHTSELQSPM